MPKKIECGQHWEASAVDVARDVTARFLVLHGIIETQVRPISAMQYRMCGYAAPCDFKRLFKLPMRTLAALAVFHRRKIDYYQRRQRSPAAFHRSSSPYKPAVL